MPNNLVPAVLLEEKMHAPCMKDALSYHDQSHMQGGCQPPWYCTACPHTCPGPEPGAVYEDMGIRQLPKPKSQAAGKKLCPLKSWTRLHTWNMRESGSRSPHKTRACACTCNKCQTVASAVKAPSPGQLNSRHLARTG